MGSAPASDTAPESFSTRTTAASSSRKRPSLKNIASIAFLVVALALLLVAVYNQRSDFLAAASRVRATDIALSVTFGLVALFIGTLAWRECIRATSSTSVPIRDAVSTVGIAGLGKYVPGAVWPIIAQTEMLGRHGIKRGQAATGSALTLVVSTATAIVVGAVALFASGGSVIAYWWLIPVALGCATLLLPPVLTRLLAAISRLHNRFGGFADIQVASAPMVRAVLLQSISWVLWGLDTWVIFRALTPMRSAPVPLSIGAFAIAWAVGFIIVIAPGGIGPREAALVALLAPVAGATDVLALAVILRMLSICLDIVAAGVGAAFRGFGRRVAFSGPGQTGEIGVS